MQGVPRFSPDTLHGHAYTDPYQQSAPVPPAMGNAYSPDTHDVPSDDTMGYVVCKISPQNVDYSAMNPTQKRPAGKTCGSGVMMDLTGLPIAGRGGAVVQNLKGVIVTNAHVVRASIEVMVAFPMMDSHVSFPAYVVGACPELDIAVIRLHPDAQAEWEKRAGRSGTKLPRLMLQGTLRPGQDVTAWGYPLGRGLRVTKGNVSGFDTYSNHSFIQHTAPINPGNSGGGLFSSDYRLIGINSQYIPGTEAFYYARPASDLAATIADILSTDQQQAGTRAEGQAVIFHTPSLGVYTQPLRGMMTKVHNRSEGLLVTHVLKDSVAGRAGIPALCVITAFQVGDTVYNINEWGEIRLPNTAGQMMGAQAIFFYVSRFQAVRVHLYSAVDANIPPFVDIALYNSSFKMKKYMYGLEPAPCETLLACTMTEISYNLLDELGATDMPHLGAYASDPDASGVVITQVFNGTDLYETGIVYPGIVIHKIRAERVYTIQDVISKVLDAITHNERQLIVEFYPNYTVAVLDIGALPGQISALNQQGALNPSVFWATFGAVYIRQGSLDGAHELHFGQIEEMRKEHNQRKEEKAAQQQRGLPRRPLPGAGYAPQTALLPPTAQPTPAEVAAVERADGWKAQLAAGAIKMARNMGGVRGGGLVVDRSFRMEHNYVPTSETKPATAITGGCI
jgi:S1-C subfamily serine protease